MPPVQCVILGAGFELLSGTAGEAVASPAIIAELLFDARRFGFRNVLLITASGEAADLVASLSSSLSMGEDFNIEPIVVPPGVGTLDALRRVADRLDPNFLLLNGGSVTDINWLDLAAWATPEQMTLALALRPRAGGRFQLDGDHVVLASGPAAGGHDFGGIAWAARERLLRAGASSESNFLPALIAGAELAGRSYSGGFVDGASAGIDVAAALRRMRTRPALFLDRDGVLNFDHGYVHDIAKLDWIDGAIAAVKLANDLGYYVFVVTNQSGVARGLFAEGEVLAFHAAMQRALRRQGGHIDDIRYCPFHPDGVVARYACASDWRKPAPGMLLDLLRYWPVEIGRSRMIGDKDLDIAAAEQAGVRGLLFPGGNLEAFVRAALDPDVPSLRA